MSDQPDLSLFTVSELIDEVRSRHTHALILLVADGKIKAENTDIITRYNKGGSWALIGLARVYCAWAENQFADDAQPWSGDGE